MVDTISTSRVATEWAAFVDVLARHHFEARSDLPACTCGARIRTRHGFARHQIMALVPEGALPLVSVTEWGLLHPVSDPVVMPFADALRETNRADSTSRIVYRTVYPPTEWVDDHDIAPGQQPA